MIDIHSHILPGVDDGAPTNEVALRELRTFYNNGVREVILTPHFVKGHYQVSPATFDKKLKNLKFKLLEEGISLKFHKGAEIYADSEILKEIKPYSLNLADSNYVLIETDLTSIPETFYQVLYQLQKKRYYVILAHPERYNDVIKDFTVLENLFYREVYFQVNAGSLIGLYGQAIQKTAWKIIKNRYAHFLASDSHCWSNNFHLGEAIEQIKDCLDEDYIEDLIVKNPQRIINNQKIDFFKNKNLQKKPKSFFEKILKLLKVI